MVYTERDRLERRIKKLRNEMIQSAAATGLNSNKTIYYSQKLDQLIMTYQRETRECEIYNDEEI